MILGVLQLILCNIPLFFCEICGFTVKKLLFPIVLLHSIMENYMIKDRHFTKDKL